MRRDRADRIRGEGVDLNVLRSVAAATVLLVPMAVGAVPEGTRQLGLTQGLEGYSELKVFARAGERIRVCSSDDGLKEAAVMVDGQPVDLDRDALIMPANSVDAGRFGSEIIVFPPNPTACTGDVDCVAGQSCRSRSFTRLPVPVGQQGQCGIALEVTQVRGYCNAQQDAGDRNWHEVAVDAEGDWNINFVGEPETLTGSGSSVRFFEVDVVDGGGASAPGGRLHTESWALNAHSFAYGADTEFFVLAEVNQGARVFSIDFENLAGFRWFLVSNARGLQDHPSQSWCAYGDPFGDGCLTATQARNAQPPVDQETVFSGYEIYINYPDPAPAAPPEPTLDDVQFNDEAGTGTITPNGDGNQDTGTFSFESNVNGTYEIIIDTDGDGTLERADDRVLRGNVRVGTNEVLWDGNGPDGQPAGDGAYRFRVRLVTAETHFPMSDIEDNSDGFVVWDVAPNGDRTALPMFAIMVVMVFILIAFPDLATYLPENMRTRPGG